MACLKSEYIVTFKTFVPYPVCCIIMQYLCNGSLKDVLHKGVLSMDTKFQIVTQIAKGLQFLHKNQVLHRDFKSLNVLIDKHFNAKISDFGLSFNKQPQNSRTNADSETNSNSIDFTASIADGAIGTYAWMAPELILNNNQAYTTKCDVYSFGVVVWEMFSATLPFKGCANVAQVMYRLKKNNRDPIPGDWSEKLKLLIRCCWNIKPEQRPNMNAIVSYLEDGDLDIFNPHLLPPPPLDQVTENKMDPPTRKENINESSVNIFFASIPMKEL